MPEVRAVIGRGFGDEGKGLAVDRLCSGSTDTIVIKHNGGAQAGHTVDLPEKRFVFHQLSSGSFRGAATFWAGTYFPDPYKLGEEIRSFSSLSGRSVKLFSDPRANIVTTDDVLINMAAETLRGSGRHGSCGMGINEAFERTKAGFGITVRDLKDCTQESLTKKLDFIRQNYGRQRLAALGLPGRDTGEYTQLLTDKNVLRNAAEVMLRNMDAVTLPADIGVLLSGCGQLVFESGQGLLLDSSRTNDLPHITASRTGLANICRVLRERNLSLNEIIYVSRSYATRHGAGPLAHECPQEDLGITGADETNLDNQWQGSLRCARYGSLAEFVSPVREDISGSGLADAGTLSAVSLLLTHLNETNGRLKLASGDMDYRSLPGKSDLRGVFDSCYVSFSRYAQDITQLW